MFMKREFLKNSNGFTLIELMQQVMEMQQSLRIGMGILVKDIMRAGMKEEDSTLVAFATAGTTTVTFGMDLGSGGVFATDGDDNDEDGVEDDDPDADIAALEAEQEGRIGDGDFNDTGERMRYSFTVDEDTNGNGVLDTGEDTNGNGVLDRGDLEREVWDSTIPGFGAAQTIITNVSAFEFVYLDEDENPLVPLPITAAGKLDKIDTVVITMVVRATNEDYRITNNETYQNLLLTDIYTAPGDNFRRRAMSMRVKIRNVNL